MIVFILTYFVNMLGYKGEKKNDKRFFVLTVFLLVFFTGVRYYVGGSDRYVYEGTYNAVPSLKVIIKYIVTGENQGVNKNYEIGFLILCSAIKSLGFTYFGFTLLWTILFYTLLIKGLKEFVPSWSIFFAVFMYKLMFYDTYISIRQGLTIAMFCYMLRFLRDNKWKSYFLWAFVAAIMHNGAGALFLLFFARALPISKRFIIFYSLAFLPTVFISERVDLSSLILSVGNLIGNSKADHWINANEEISLIYTIECYLLIFLVLKNYDKLLMNPRREEVKLVLRVFLIAVPMFTLFRDWIIFIRIKDYCVLMYGIVLGYLLDAHFIQKNMETRIHSSEESVGKELNWIYHNEQLIAMGVFIACFIGMMRYIYAFDGGHLMHYETFFFKPGASFFK